MTPSQPHISLILPCYHPPEGWAERIFSQYGEFCKAVSASIELIIVVDGDPDIIASPFLATLQQKISLLKIVTYTQNRGKGYAIRQGLAQATAPLIIYTDIDFPYTINSMTAVVHALQTEGYDIAIGIKNAEYYRHVPPARKRISKWLQGMIKAFLNIPITDTQCGLKGFKATVSPVFAATTIDRYLFDLEFVRNSYKAKIWQIKAIPVALHPNVKFRRMNYRILLPELLNFTRLLWKPQK
ncbi:MAG: glycosyltransferase [Chitinophagia bacterium]|nr:glycosyltransferase [Chitinophagia bacterium]